MWLPKSSGYKCLKNEEAKSVQVLLEFKSKIRVVIFN